MRKFAITALMALFGVFLVAIGGLVHSNQERRQAESNIKAQYEPIVKAKDAQGVETASRAAQENTVKAVAKQDSKLGKAVKNEGSHTRSATVVAVETTGAVVATPPDPGDSSFLAFNDEWIQARVTLSGDSPTLAYRVRNELEIFQVNKRTGLFSPPELEVKVRNLNPHSTVTDVQSFTVVPTRRRTGLWLGLGFAAGATGVLFLLN